LSISILIDENVDYRIVTELRKHQYIIISVAENHKGISDADIINLAIEMNSLILTEDRDFGQLIFADRKKSLGIIFLRYFATDFFRIATQLIRLINEYQENLYNKFVVITTKRIRIREIP